MKKINLIIAISTIALYSCTEMIDIDLNSSDPQIVVEANLKASENATVKLTKSVNFDEDNIFPSVQNAIVTISDNSGNSETLTEISPGFYQSLTLTGSIGNTYTLNIDASGKFMNSVSIIPQQVSFDSLIVNEITNSGGGGPGGEGSSHEVIVEYKDPANVKNYYNFVEFVNGEITGNYAFDDRLNDGLEVERILPGNNRKLNAGDILQIEMQCIDEAVYEYYNSFGNLFGGPSNSATPANPNTNMEGTELGYFSAHTTEIKKTIIQ